MIDMLVRMGLLLCLIVLVALVLFLVFSMIVSLVSDFQMIMRSKRNDRKRN